MAIVGLLDSRMAIVGLLHGIGRIVWMVGWQW